MDPTLTGDLEQQLRRAIRRSWEGLPACRSGRMSSKERSMHDPGHHQGEYVQQGRRSCRVCKAVHTPTVLFILFCSSTRVYIVTSQKIFQGYFWNSGCNRDNHQMALLSDQLGVGHQVAHQEGDPLQKSWKFGEPVRAQFAGRSQRTRAQHKRDFRGHKDHGSLPRPRKSLIRNATSSRPRQGARTGDFLDYKAWNFKIVVSEENVD